MNKIKFAIASDHAGYILKEEIKNHFRQQEIEFIDCGTENETDSVNYPDFAHKLCLKIQSGEAERGILVCGTGIGMSIAANKHKGIRAACCSDTFSARLTRMHNDANVLCIGARVVGAGLALDLVDIFVETKFGGGRHERRVNMLKDFEK